MWRHLWIPLHCFHIPYIGRYESVCFGLFTFLSKTARHWRCALFLFCYKDELRKSSYSSLVTFAANIAKPVQCYFFSHFLDGSLFMALTVLCVIPSPLSATLGATARMELWTWSFPFQPHLGRLWWPLISPSQPWVFGKELSVDVSVGKSVLSPIRYGDIRHQS